MEFAWIAEEGIANAAKITIVKRYGKFRIRYLSTDFFYSVKISFVRKRLERCNEKAS